MHMILEQVLPGSLRCLESSFSANEVDTYSLVLAPTTVEFVVTNCDTNNIENDDINAVTLAGKKITVKVEDKSPSSLRKSTTILKTRIRLDE